MANQVILCDLDGTLANIEHRLKYLETKDWDGFFGAVAKDTPNQWCVELLRAMRDKGFGIIFLSGRNEVCRDDTIKWLNNLGFSEEPVYMRAEKDHRPDFVVKQAIYDKYLKHEDVLFVLEDRKQVVDMWRKKGLTVLHCEEGEF